MSKSGKTPSSLLTPLTSLGLGQQGGQGSASGDDKNSSSQQRNEKRPTSAKALNLLRGRYSDSSKDGEKNSSSKDRRMSAQGPSRRLALIPVLDFGGEFESSPSSN